MENVRFIFPIDGDFLDKNDVIKSGNDLLINVRVYAPSAKYVEVNGLSAYKNDSEWHLSLPVADGKNTLHLVCEGNACEDITVYFFPHIDKKYRISVDDNILFLRNINNNKDVYTSIFDDPYLSVYKKAHDLYGARVNLNLFYETDDMPKFSDKGEYFNLSMMTDKFKDEWEANADWLRLTFHANAEHPSKPYITSDYNEVFADADKIHREIIRFAGEKSLSPTTTVHWGEATKEGTLALKDLGYKTLAGYFELSADCSPVVAYYYPTELIEHVGARDLWMNHETGILHSRIDLVLNTIRYDELEEKLQKIYSDPHRSGFIELMIHEQYFYPEYNRYIPEFGDMVVNAAKWVFERGYTGTFIEDLSVN